MKLETTQDLLERLRARFEGCSYYRLSKTLGIPDPTIANWKHGRSGIGREHVTRVAEALGESAEYVLACVEHEREQDAGARKLWRRIAERFRSTASILLVALGLMTAHGRAAATMLDVGSAEIVKPPVYTLCATRRRRVGRLAKLLRCLKSQSPGPLPPPWARMLSTGLAPSRLSA
jgi:plasmid maintenance system antidote protein VapI